MRHTKSHNYSRNTYMYITVKHMEYKLKTPNKSHSFDERHIYNVRIKITLTSRLHCHPIQ